MAVLHKLIIRVVYSNRAGVQVFWVFTATFTLVESLPSLFPKQKKKRNYFLVKISSVE